MPSETKVSDSTTNIDVQPQQESKFKTEVEVWNGARNNMTLLCAGILLLPLPYLKYLGALLIVAACIRNRKDDVSFSKQKGITRIISVGLAISTIAIFVTEYAIARSGQAFSDTFLLTQINRWYHGEIMVLFYLILALLSFIAVFCFPYVLFYTERNRVYWVLAICVSMLSVIAAILLYLQPVFQATLHLLLIGQMSSVGAVSKLISLFSYMMILFEIPYGILLYSLLKGVYRAAYESESF